ncbi:NAD(P)-dependent oxidoreductase [Rhodobacteraceae bacterium SC52]|nr:NAD(P)-dependent oxidoreductase [Rhodobacteraceae bacterium SC52]
MPMASRSVAIFGLGAMGSGMAGALLKAGLKTHGFDINQAAVEAFQAKGGASGDIADVADTLDAVVIVVVNAAQTEAVLFGENGIADKLIKGTVIVACATMAPESARDLAQRCNAMGLLYLDAPVSGGTLRAGDGTLSILASGSAAAFERAGPALEAMSSNVFALGDAVGAGSSMKAINQMLVGVHIAAMGEAISFGVSQGVAPKQFLEVIQQCAGTSWALESRAPHVVSGDYTPLSAVDIWLKDLGIVQDIAKSAQFDAPLTEAALKQFTEASAAGLGREDDAAIAKHYARRAGLTLPGDG